MKKEIEFGQRKFSSQFSKNKFLDPFDICHIISTSFSLFLQI